MVIKNISLLAAIALSGCAIFEPIDDMFSLDEQAQYSELNIEQQTQETELAQGINDGSPLASSFGFKNQFRQNFQQQNDQQQAEIDKQAHVAEMKNKIRSQTQLFKRHNINHYAKGLMQDLVANLQHVNSTTPVAIVSFVMIDSDYNDSNLLGIQIAESLIHEVHKFGIPVIDFKTTGYIRVTEQGDFAFSKDYEDFNGEMAARFILGGTMLKHTDGYLINARIVEIQSQAVVASAQSFIPNKISDPILIMSTASKLPNSNQTIELGTVVEAMYETSSLEKVANRVSLIQN